MSITGVDGRCKWRAVVADFATGFCGLINAVGLGVRCRSGEDEDEEKEVMVVMEKW